MIKERKLKGIYNVLMTYMLSISIKKTRKYVANQKPKLNNNIDIYIQTKYVLLNRISFLYRNKYLQMNPIKIVSNSSYPYHK
jgi:hypothetical protein